LLILPILPLAILERDRAAAVALARRGRGLEIFAAVVAAGFRRDLLEHRAGRRARHVNGGRGGGVASRRGTERAEAHEAQSADESEKFRHDVPSPGELAVP